MTVDIDANGILNVSASDKTTGKSNRITITNDKGRLSKEEIERMVNDAEKYKAEDEAAAARITAKNGLESYAYSLKNSLSDVKAKLPDKSSEIAALETKLDETVKWLEASQQALTEEYEERRKEIEEASTPLMKAFYEQGGAAGGALGGFPSAGAAGGAHEDGPSVEEVD